MSNCTLIRHGQASFGAANYDQLSPLGAQQCEALGAFWRSRFTRLGGAKAAETAGRAPPAEQPTTLVVVRGTLERHRQSLEAFTRGWGQVLPKALVTPALNEYDSEALIQALPPVDLPPPHTPEGYKAHFRRLREALQAWMAAAIEPQGMPTFLAFQEGVVSTLTQVCTDHPGSNIVVFSSGGPISVALAHYLGAPSSTAIELNLQLRNSSYSELMHRRSRMQVVSINGLAHLEQDGRWDWVTHA